MLTTGTQARYPRSLGLAVAASIALIFLGAGCGSGAKTATSTTAPGVSPAPAATTTPTEKKAPAPGTAIIIGAVIQDNDTSDVIAYAQAAIDDANKERADKPQLYLVKENYTCDTNKGTAEPDTAAVGRLVAAQPVKAILYVPCRAVAEATDFSGVMKAANGVPVLAVRNIANISIQGGGRGFFGFYPPVSQGHRADIAYAVRGLTLKRGAILSFKDSYNDPKDDDLAGIKEMFTLFGVETTAVESVADHATVTDENLAHIADPKVQFLVINGISSSAIDAYAAIRAKGLDLPVFGTSDSELTDAVRAKGVGFMYPKYVGTKAATFTKAMSARGLPLSSSGRQAYEAVAVLSGILTAVDQDPASVTTALYGVTDHEGASSTLSVDATGGIAFGDFAIARLRGEGQTDEIIAEPSVLKEASGAAPAPQAVTDTDGDGLSDADERNIYHTDPLKADTDGDGYTDGAEVKAGYNPNGPGKL